MAAVNLSRILAGLFRMRDASDPTRIASVGADGKVATSDTTLATRLGEVQASPTANTVLDRLKTIAAALAGTLAVSPPALASSTAIVANLANLSGVVDCRAGKPVGILFPPSLNNLANLTGIQVSFDNVTYYSLLNADGSAFTAIPLTASGALPLSLLNTQFINYLKLQFGTNANASTAFKVILAP